MTFFPVKYKPEFDFSNYPVAFEYPNVITKEMANEIIDFAINSDGWHRRGSKTSEYVDAAFTTCLLHDSNHPIYEVLDPLWKRMVDEHNFNISFIEYYEVKEYLPGDGFGLHLDSHGRIEEKLDRKLNLVVQLSDPLDYEGGELFVHKHQATKDFGSAIFFPSHYIHQVKTITAGKRYILIGHGWGESLRG